MLESLEHARGRGAEIVCELRGYGASADAYHLTDPEPSGRWQLAAMRQALATGGLAPEDVDYVNAHGTSTPAGDPVEISAIRQLVGDERAAEVRVSSTKSMHGHGMGAAGGFETVLTALAIREGAIPPTINLDELDPACAGVDHVANEARRGPVRVALSNSFGFGGHNAVIALVGDGGRVTGGGERRRGPRARRGDRHRRRLPARDRPRGDVALGQRGPLRGRPDHALRRLRLAGADRLRGARLRPVRLHGPARGAAHGPLRPVRRGRRADGAWPTPGCPIDRDGEGIGAIIGNGGSGTISREEQHRVMLERGPDRVSPFAIPLSVANMGAGQVSMELGLRGPVTAVCTACAAGTDAIGTALEVIRRGDARAMLAGGADTLISPYFVAGFDAMRVLSHRNDDPAGAARPFDRDRDGFLVGEAGAVLVLEPLEDARARGADVICEVAGYGASADAYHITDPDPTRRAPGAGGDRGDRGRRAGSPDQVDHVNAHGGASKPGDPAEVRVLQLALGEEAAARVAVERDQVDARPLHGRDRARSRRRSPRSPSARASCPPTINLHEVDPACVGVDHVANEARPADLRVAMSTSFGLGGHNSALVLTRAEDGDRS